MTNSATARSRKRSPTRTCQSHTALHHCGDQVAFQENGPTYVASSSRRILTVSGRYAATARSKFNRDVLGIRPTDQSCHHEVWIHFSHANVRLVNKTELATLSAASKTGGRAKKGAIHATKRDHSRCGRKKDHPYDSLLSLTATHFHFAVTWIHPHASMWSKAIGLPVSLTERPPLTKKRKNHLTPNDKGWI